MFKGYVLIFNDMSDDLKKKVFDEIVSQYKGFFWHDRGQQRALAKELGLNPASITYWKKHGIPKSYLPYFKLRFPSLSIWKELK